MRTELLTIDDASAWDALVDVSPQASPFVTRTWLRVYAEVHGIHPLLLLLYSDSLLAGGCPLLLKKRGPVSYSPVMAIGNYHGLLLHPSIVPGPITSVTWERTVDIVQRAVEKHVAYYSATLHPSLATNRPARRHGWTVLPQKTYVSDITRTEECWKSMSQSFRRKIRRAAEDGFTVHEEGDVESLVRMHHASYRRKEIDPPIPDSLLIDWVTALHHLKLVRIFELRTRRGIPVASRAIAGRGSTAYDFLAGMDSLHAAAGATHFLVWEILRLLSAEGYTFFDFMGANTPGPAEFKRGFGGEPVPYLGLTYHGSKMLRLIEIGRQRVRMKKRGL